MNVYEERHQRDMDEYRRVMLDGKPPLRSTARSIEEIRRDSQARASAVYAASRAERTRRDTATPAADSPSTRKQARADRKAAKAAVKSVNTRRPTARQRAAAKKAATPAGKARAASQEAKAQGKSWAEQNRLGAVARSEAARASGLCTVHVTQTIPFSGGRVDLLDRNPAGLRRGQHRPCNGTWHKSNGPWWW